MYEIVTYGMKRDHLVEKECDVCLSPDAMMPFVEVGLIGIGPAWIHQCVKCGFRQIRPRLDESDLDALYGGDYFDTDATHGFRDYSRQKQRYERDAFFFVKDLHHFKAFFPRSLSIIFHLNPLQVTDFLF